MRWLKRVGLALGALILVAAAVAGFSYLSYRNHMRIDIAKGIDEAGYVRIGGDRSVGADPGRRPRQSRTALAERGAWLLDDTEHICISRLGGALHGRDVGSAR